MTKVKLIQMSKYRWELFSPEDKLITANLFNSQYEAEQWVKNYISSFNGWSYILLPKGS